MFPYIPPPSFASDRSKERPDAAGREDSKKTELPVYHKPWWYSDIQETELLALVESGDVKKVRAFFDNGFWNKQSIQADWGHLREALVRENKPMMRLLITWGASATDNEVAEFAASDKYPAYVQLLRQCGVRVKQIAVQEKPMEIGQMVAGKGVYVGTWEPSDSDGKSLQKHSTSSPHRRICRRR